MSTQSDSNRNESAQDDIVDFFKPSEHFTQRRYALPEGPSAVLRMEITCSKKSLNFSVA